MSKMFSQASTPSPDMVPSVTQVTTRIVQDEGFGDQLTMEVGVSSDWDEVILQINGDYNFLTYDSAMALISALVDKLDEIDMRDNTVEIVLDDTPPQDPQEALGFLFTR